MRERDRLTALDVRRKTEPGLHPDGGGLYLQITPAGTKSWILKFQLNGRARAMGLGSLHIVGLADARLKRDEAHRLLRDGIDPIEVRKGDLQRKRLETAKAMTFREAAIACISAREAEWRNPKHIAQWPKTLSTFVYPIIGALPVQAVDTALVMRVLEPIWTTKPETASRVRGRIEAVLDWAKVCGYRQGENPARWRGHLEMLLPKKSKVRKVQHHAALRYVEAGSFMASLREQEGVTAGALEFLILTATRSGETLNAEWREISLREKLWIIPASRMKAEREHRVPLSDAALAVLERMQSTRQSDIVFPGFKNGLPLSNKSLLRLLARMGRRDVTAHGFRSTFRDWAAEKTGFPGDLVEMALAHAVGNKVEAAYRRGDMFDKRRKLMADWADYCGQLPAANEDNVIPIRGLHQVPG